MWLSKIHNFIAQNGYLSTTFTNISKRHRKYNNYESAQVSFSLVQIWGTCMLYLSISISRYISEANTLLLTPIYSSDRFSHRLLFRQVLVLQWLGRCSYSKKRVSQKLQTHQEHGVSMYPVKDNLHIKSSYIMDSKLPYTLVNPPWNTSSTSLDVITWCWLCVENNLLATMSGEFRSKEKPLPANSNVWAQG